MSYHHCTIEPSDWSDGPDDGDECPECGGDGWADESAGDPCPRCHGYGYLIGDDYSGLEFYPEDKA